MTKSLVERLRITQNIPAPDRLIIKEAADRIELAHKQMDELDDINHALQARIYALEAELDWRNFRLQRHIEKTTSRIAKLEKVREAVEYEKYTMPVSVREALAACGDKDND